MIMNLNRRKRKIFNAAYIIFGTVLLIGIFMRLNNIELWYYPQYISLAGGTAALVIEVSLLRRKLETNKNLNS